MAFRSGIFTLAALAPVIAGCGVAKHFLPGGARHDGGHLNVSPGESCLLPPDAELSCAAFAIEGSAASPPVFLEDGEIVEEVEEGDSDPLPLTAPGSDDAKKMDRSVLEPPPSMKAAGYELPAPVVVETEEDARIALALEAASLASSPRRLSTDVAVGPLREPTEQDPLPHESQALDLPLVPPASRLIENDEPARADYVHAPLAKVASRLHLPHRRLADGVVMRPGLIAGLHGRIAGHRETPEPVPFVVYERVAPRFLPVPTRPAFEPATAAYAAHVSPDVAPRYRITPPLSVTPSPFAPPPAPPKADLNIAPPAEETLPRPLPAMEALPLPQPGTALPPAPRIDDL